MMEAMEIMDVTVIEPRLKHPRIFEKFDSLKGGESFIIKNDHDPKPLYYQMLSERGNIFSWEYLKDGPEEWQVRIAKLSEEEQETVGEIAARDMQKAAVFKKYGIDFCCGGKKTLKQVCDEKDLDINSVKTDLRRNNTISTEHLPRYQNWSIDFLADYIVGNHHDFVRRAIPELTLLVSKVAEVHGGSNPELHRIREVFATLSEELRDHMLKEEEKLFPLIRKIARSEDGGHTLKAGTLQDLVDMLEDEHDTAGRLLEEMRELSNDYRVPEGGCTSYKLLYNKLEEFENDMHQHIHLENNILFPKTIERIR